MSACAQACRTPPHNAANGFNGGSAEVVRLLVAAGANINAVDNVRCHTTWNT